MKNVIIAIASALVSVSAFAGEFSKPVSVNFQSASTFVPAKKVCRDGDSLKHVSKEQIAVTVCQGNDGKSQCKTTYKRLLQPVVSTAQRCAKFGGSDSKNCVAWETYTLDQSRVRVFGFNSRTDMEQNENGSFIGWYTIPACN